MPFVKIDVKEEVAVRLDANPELKKQWLNTASEYETLAKEQKLNNKKI